MNNDLAADRARLRRLLTATDHDPLSRRIGMTAALAQARYLDHWGDIDDTRQLASVLTRAVFVEQQRGDLRAIDMLAGELLAVLSDLADAGDEEMAIGVNVSADDVSLQVIEIARAYTRRRRCRVRP